MAKIKHLKGDLFSCHVTDSLCHCVSRDLAMSKGIATLFKRKFSGVSELKNQKKKVGEVAALKRQNRFIYYLITKERYFHKPTLANLEQSLTAMRNHAESNSVRNISMPKIGCGLDRLKWPDVEKLLTKTFRGYACRLTV